MLNKRLHGWVLQLLDFNFEIVYGPGQENQDADALSRQAWDSNDGDPCAAPMKEMKEQPREHLSEQPRSTAALEGGDVGTAHIREKDAEEDVEFGVRTAHTEEEEEEKDKEKEKEQKRENKRHCCDVVNCCELK